MHDIAADRVEYHGQTLDGVNAATSPYALFRSWLEAAYEAGNPEPTAMQVATVALGGDGVPRPSVRTVLLKEVDERGFVFFSNYRSRKGREIEAQPQVALQWYWPALARAVRVEGTAVRVDRQESEAYFASRPRGSQLGAWASQQSAELDSRAELLAAYARVGEEFRGREVPCPEHWGGWRVPAGAIEFWQGEPSRLHDRVRFTREGTSWQLHRLAP
ncbi:Pyridoxamine 5'-phosphate oxidase [Raineyella antarctica]|uniref:Pyridoxine/pyridoxamine 5'-phosphate oxidase n=1 Tax=Raineyella antarctica TaxID=1577474 RepID=A0A1G6GEA8_9ACTN|nr:pyridoxamine 5'-phosphate oxidase [Raineyella antarctica]SDB80331.1 Pyridoxamine 5'-phosphate oxidase [Raineyella antarctica]